MFLGAALEEVDAADLDREPVRKLATWLFSLGVIDALAARLGLDAGASSVLAVDALADFYTLDPPVAAGLVGRLRQLGDNAYWQHAREAGHGAMGRWLEGSDPNGQLALARLLEEPPGASALRQAARLTDLPGNAAREAERRAPTREQNTQPRPAASVLSTH